MTTFQLETNDMAVIHTDELTTVSFPDCNISEFVLTDSELKCELDGVHTDRQGLVEAKVLLSISNWHRVTIERFDATGKNPAEVGLKDSGALREICECTLRPNSASFAGFERETGQWQKYTFESATVRVKVVASTSLREDL